MFHRIKVFFYINILLSALWGGREVYGEFRVNPSLRMQESYDSNFFSASQGQNPSGTSVTTITPTINISYLQKRFSLNGRYSHNLRYLSQTSEFRDDGTSSANANIDLVYSERTSFSFNDSLTYTEDTISSRIVTTGIQTGRTNRITNNFSFVTNHTISPLASIRITLNDRFEKFLQSDLIDSRTDSIELMGSYELNPKRNINSTYTYTNFYFDAAGGERNRGSHSARVGFTELFSPSLSFNLSGGATYNPEPDDYSWILTAGLMKTFQTSSVNLSYNRSVSNTSGLTADISINQTVSAGWNINISNTFGINITGNFSNNRSISSAIVETDSYRVGLNSNWQLNKWMNAGFGYFRSQQFAYGLAGSDISRDVAFFNVLFTPEEWRF